MTDQCILLWQLALFSRLTYEVLARRAAKQYDAESMTLAAKLLEQNPEVYTVWNYRREALQDTLQACESQISTLCLMFPRREHTCDVGHIALGVRLSCDSEVALLTLQGEYGFEAADAAVRTELQLTETALQKNPKSYASWHHRKWLVELGVVSLEHELKLVTKYAHLPLHRI